MTKGFEPALRLNGYVSTVTDEYVSLNSSRGSDYDPLRMFGSCGRYDQIYSIQVSMLAHDPPDAFLGEEHSADARVVDDRVGHLVC